MVARDRSSLRVCQRCLRRVCAPWPQAIASRPRPDAGEQEQRLDNWEVAARYQMYHGLALIAVGLLASGRSRRLLHVAAAAFSAGVLIFSGCLYAYVLTGAKPWAMIVPVGGYFFC